MENGLAGLSIKEESPTKAPAVKFKSYKTGTLMTNNGVPADGFITPFPAPLPSPKVSQLSAATPAFVPRAPQLPVTPSAQVFPAPNTNTPAYQRVQNLLQDIRSPFIAGPSNGQQYNPFYTTSNSGPSSMMQTPQYHNQYGVVRPPRVFYQRSDKSKKDIIIVATGAIRNAVKVVESFLPNGSPFHEYTPEYDSPNYDFVAEFNKMSGKDKANLMANKQIEILVMLTTYDEKDKVEMIVAEKKGKRKGSKGKGRAAALNETNDAGKGVCDLVYSKANVLTIAKGFLADADVSTAGMNALEGGPITIATDIKGKGKEEVVTNEVGAEGGVNAARTVIDTINTLGPDFAINTKSLYVTLDFTTIPAPEVAEPSIPTGPRGAPGLMPPPGPLCFGTNFEFITSLVRTLQSFTELKHCVVNLRVPSGHSSRPISIQHLTLVLPFYDLGFTDWKVSYQTEFLTTSVPVRDHDYPLKWLDRERNKILLKREKKLQNAVFVRRSGVEGKVATWNKQK